jgi:hypothetical protein
LPQTWLSGLRLARSGALHHLPLHRWDGRHVSESIGMNAHSSAIRRAGFGKPFHFHESNEAGASNSR